MMVGRFCIWGLSIMRLSLTFRDAHAGENCSKRAFFGGTDVNLKTDTSFFLAYMAYPLAIPGRYRFRNDNRCAATRYVAA